MVAIAHNAKDFDLLFVVNRFVRRKVAARVHHHEGAEDHVFEGGECHLARQPQLLGHATQKFPREIRFHGPEIVVSSPF